MLDEATKQRFEAALASGKLKELSDEMREEGLGRAAIYDLYESYWKYLGEMKREADEELFGDILERMVGWCPAGSLWFEECVTNEEIYAFRSGLTEQQVLEVSELISKQAVGQHVIDVRRSSDGDLVVTTMLFRRGAVSRTIFHVRQNAGGWEILNWRKERPENETPSQPSTNA